MRKIYVAVVRQNDPIKEWRTFEVPASQFKEWRGNFVAGHLNLPQGCVFLFRLPEEGKEPHEHDIVLDDKPINAGAHIYCVRP